MVVGQELNCQIVDWGVHQTEQNTEVTMNNKIAEAVKVSVFITVIAFIVCSIVAIFLANKASRDANLKNKSSRLIIEGILVSELEYFRQNESFSADFTLLHFPEQINQRLIQLGSKYVVTSDILENMKNGEYIHDFKYMLSFNETRDKGILLILPDIKFCESVFWLCIDAEDTDIPLFGNDVLNSDMLETLLANPLLLCENKLLNESYIVQNFAVHQGL